MGSCMSRSISDIAAAQRRSAPMGHLRAIGLPGILICLGMLLKPFYLLPSGSFQLGDAAVLLAFFCALVQGRDAFRIEKNDMLLALFVACVLVINLSYFCTYQTADFVLQSLYYVFNLFAVFVFRQKICDCDFLLWFSRVLRLDLAIQIIIYFVGAGRWYSPDRYMGTFNDPNQLAFFVFCAYLAIQLLDRKRGTGVFLVDDLMAAFLIYQSASTGMLMGFVLVLLPRVGWAFGAFFSRGCAVPVLIVLAAITVLFSVAAIGGVDAKSVGDAPIIQRLEHKVANIIDDGAGLLDQDSAFVKDRQLDKLILYPEQMLYGAGQGSFNRFSGTVSANEVHSTFPGMLWYYGVVPFAVLVCWMIANFKHGNNDKIVWLYYLAFFIETCTLANQRQPLFWFLLVLGAL